MTIFNQHLLRLHAQRAARMNAAPIPPALTFAAEEMSARLHTVKRPLHDALAIGRFSHLPLNTFPVRSLIQTSLARSPHHPSTLIANPDHLPFKPHSFHLILALFSLHTCNELPRTLATIRTLLHPDGLLLATLPGPQTLLTLRNTLHQTEINLANQTSPRIYPFYHTQHLGNLLMQCGFTLPVADTETFSTTCSFKELTHTLRALGQTNALQQRNPSPPPRALFPHTPLTIELETIHLTAWAPHPSQPKPLRPGSATTSLADALDPTRSPR